MFDLINTLKTSFDFRSDIEIVKDIMSHIKNKGHYGSLRKKELKKYITEIDLLKFDGKSSLLQSLKNFEKEI